MGLHLTKKNAEETALEIERYWKTKGKTVNVWTEKLGYTDHVVRSDLWNGKPRDYWQ